MDDSVLSRWLYDPEDGFRMEITFSDCERLIDNVRQRIFNFEMNCQYRVKKVGITVSPTQYLMLREYFTRSNSAKVRALQTELSMFGYELVPVFDGILIDHNDVYAFLLREKGLNKESHVDAIVNYGFSPEEINNFIS